jgi:hypothetical protein
MLSRGIAVVSLAAIIVSAVAGKACPDAVVDVKTPRNTKEIMMRTIVTSQWVSEREWCAITAVQHIRQTT